MKQSGHASNPFEDPIMDGMDQVTRLVLGPDRLTRLRTAATLLCAIVYAICVGAAFTAADLGLMRPYAPWLLSLSMPVYGVFYLMIRSGFSKRFKDPTLLMTQNLCALIAIAFAYMAIGPLDRGAVLVLVPLVIVFGIYAHTPIQSVMVGAVFLLFLGMIMGGLAHLDPVFYPPPLELLRFELLVGTLPTICYAAYLTTTWRARLAVQRTELRKTLAQVQELATRDVLTTLYNRRYMQEKLEDSVARFNRYGEPFTIVLVDLDHFKRINDQHGHKAGDQALMAFASAAGMVLRDTDVLARWGGEEFLFLLPSTGPTKAIVAMERLRAALGNCASQPDAVMPRIGFSAGIAVHDRPGALSQTLDRADRALYRAKEEGRGRDVLAPSEGR